MGALLESIHSPADLKRMNSAQMAELAEEIRAFLIQTLSKTGGHLGPNLGVVELTLALHTVFNTPTDKLLFDVSHQAYIHKILTGRREQLDTIRQPGGLNGFMLRTESEHDCYGAGHAGTALSAALGMAVARDLAGGTENVVAVAGDAAFTNGISFEALNNIAEQTKRLIVVLNDNEWSIDRNVGAIARYFHRIVTNEHYQHLHDSAAQDRAEDRRQDGGEGDAPRRGSRQGHAVALHAVRGVRPGVLRPHRRPQHAAAGGDIQVSQERRPSGPAPRAHAEGPRLPARAGPAEEVPRPGPLRSRDRQDRVPQASRPGPKPSPLRWSSLPNQDSRVVAITAAMPNGTGLDLFRPHHPKRYFDVGIAEEHAVIFAAGMATRGFRPVCAIYSTFLQRAFDPIVHDVALQKLPVLFCMDRAGLSGDDGPTHHGLFDIAYLRGIPEMVLMSPADEDELADMMKTALSLPGPSAIRYPRGPVPGVARKQDAEILPVGKGRVISDGSDVAILGLGHMMPLALELAKRLESEGYSAAVINPRFIKPLDREMLGQFARRVAAFVTFEDHVRMGGFGSAMIEALEELGFSVPVVRMGWPDQFIEHGKIDGLRKKYGLTVADAYAQVLPLLSHRQRRTLVAS